MTMTECEAICQALENPTDERRAEAIRIVRGIWVRQQDQLLTEADGIYQRGTE